MLDAGTPMPALVFQMTMLSYGKKWYGYKEEDPPNNFPYTCL
jgi:hypothetical protein